MKYFEQFLSYSPEKNALSGMYLKTIKINSTNTEIANSPEKKMHFQACIFFLNQKIKSTNTEIAILRAM